MFSGACVVRGSLVQDNVVRGDVAGVVWLSGVVLSGVVLSGVMLSASTEVYAQSQSSSPPAAKNWSSTNKTTSEKLQEQQ